MQSWVCSQFGSNQREVAKQKEDLRVLLEHFDEQQMDRYEAYRRSGLTKSSVRKVRGEKARWGLHAARKQVDLCACLVPCRTARQPSPPAIRLSVHPHCHPRLCQGLCRRDSGERCVLSWRQPLRCTDTRSVPPQPAPYRNIPARSHLATCEKRTGCTSRNTKAQARAVRRRGRSSSSSERADWSLCLQSLDSLFVSNSIPFAKLPTPMRAKKREIGNNSNLQ